MQADLVASIYNGATSIAKPLSLSAVIITLFSIITKQIIVSIQEPLGKIASKDAVTIVLKVLQYFFYISIIGLIGGLSSYALEFFLKDYVKKYDLIEKARSAIKDEDPDQIKRYSQELITRFPSFYEGYHFRGIGNFYAQDYGMAAMDFRSAYYLLPKNLDKCDNTRRDFISNLASAEISDKEYQESERLLEATADCGLEKDDLYNLAEVYVIREEFVNARKILEAKKLNEFTLPDYRARTLVLRGIMSILSQEEDWHTKSIKFFEQAISIDTEIKPIIFCVRTNFRAAPKGKSEDNTFILSVLSNPKFSVHADDFPNEYRMQMPCS